MTALAREACAAGACLESACGVLGISARTLQRWTEGGGVKEDGRLAAGERERGGGAGREAGLWERGELSDGRAGRDSDGSVERLGWVT